MSKKEQAKIYIVDVKAKAYFFLVICILINVGTFILLTNPYIGMIMLFWHPVSYLLTGFYIYFMISKFNFIKTIDRIINSDNAKERISELHKNLANDLNKTVEETSLSRKLYFGELNYNKSKSNLVIFKRKDYKIAHALNKIYNQQ